MNLLIYMKVWKILVEKISLDSKNKAKVGSTIGSNERVF